MGSPLACARRKRSSFERVDWLGMATGIVDPLRFESKAPHAASARSDASAAHSVKDDLRIATSNEVLGLKADGIDLAVRYWAEAPARPHALQLVRASDSAPVARQGIALSGETLIANLAVGMDRSLYGAHVENRRK